MCFQCRYSKNKKYFHKQNVAVSDFTKNTNERKKVLIVKHCGLALDVKLKYWKGHRVW